MSVPEEDIVEFRKNFAVISHDFDLKNIFNADETALYYNALPEKTLNPVSVPAVGSKKSKDRVTLLLGGSTLGEKLSPLVIGKYRSPRCLRGLDVKALPCTYKNSLNAWMTSEIFQHWLSEVNQKMVEQHRKILIIVDNATCHRTTREFSNIKLVFLPPNCTSVLQPMDQGVIWSFKCLFRKKLLEIVISSVEDEPKISKHKISVLEAMHFVRRAWVEVHPEVIKNAFRRTNLMPTEGTIASPPPDVSCELIQDFSEYVKIDDHLFAEDSL